MDVDEKQAARKAGGGRPRSESARKAILDAALELVQRDGYARVSVEAIAARAGTGKQTIYRWWPGKASVVLEALNQAASSDVIVPDSGSLADDLRTWLRSTFSAGRREPYRSLLPAVMAAAQLDGEFREAFRSEFLGQRRQILRTLLERAQKRGEWAPAMRLETLVDVVFGVLWYRLLVGFGSLDNRLADELTELILNSSGSRRLTAPPPRRTEAGRRLRRA